MIQKKWKELSLAAIDLPLRIFAISPMVVTAAIVYFGVIGYDNWQEHVKAEKIRPRQEHAQKLMNDMVANGMEMCDPARQSKNAETELRAALDRLMFITPKEIGNSVDAQNVHNSMAMQWATSMGVKICTDTQMDKKLAVMWHPKEKILAVNGNYNMNLLALHMRQAINEIMERGTYDRYRDRAIQPSDYDHKRPLREKFAITTWTQSPAEKMIVDESSMTPAQRQLSAPVRPQPKIGS